VDYVERLLAQIEKVSIFCIKFLFVLLLCTQALLLVPGMGSRLNLALRLEGEPLKNEALLSQAESVSSTPWTSITLELLDYQSRPDVEIEINGLEAGSFLRKEVSLAVKEGDLISIFNPVENLPVTVMVSKKTPNIQKPAFQTQVTGTGRRYFAPVKMK